MPDEVLQATVNPISLSGTSYSNYLHPVGRKTIRSTVEHDVHIFKPLYESDY